MVCLLKGTGTELLNHHVKKRNKMVATMDLDQNLFPSTASFSVFTDNIMSFNIDVGVMINVNGTISGEKGAGYSSKSSTTVLVM